MTCAYLLHPVVESASRLGHAACGAVLGLDLRGYQIGLLLVFALLPALAVLSHQQRVRLHYVCVREAVHILLRVVVACLHVRGARWIRYRNAEGDALWVLPPRAIQSWSSRLGLSLNVGRDFLVVFVECGDRVAFREVGAVLR